MRENPLMKAMGFNFEKAMFDMQWDLAQSMMTTPDARQKVGGMLYSIGHPLEPAQPTVNERKETAWKEYCTPKARRARAKASREYARKAKLEAERKRLEAEDRARTMLHIYSPSEVYDPKIHGIIEDEIEPDDDWD